MSAGLRKVRFVWKYTELGLSPAAASPARQRSSRVPAAVLATPIGTSSEAPPFAVSMSRHEATCGVSAHPARRRAAASTEAEADDELPRVGDRAPWWGSRRGSPRRGGCRPGSEVVAKPPVR